MIRLACLALMAAGLGSCSQPSEPLRACTPPRAHWVRPYCLGCGLQVLGVSFEIDHSSKLYQDGKPIKLEQLSKGLSQISMIDNPRIPVHLETEMGAECAVVEKIRDMFEKHLDCGEFGQCAEGNKDIWRHWPVPPGTPPS